MRTTPKVPVSYRVYQLFHDYHVIHHAEIFAITNILIHNPLKTQLARSQFKWIQCLNNINGDSNEYVQSNNTSYHILNQEESISRNVYQSPNRTTYWIPHVPLEYKLVPGAFYDKWEDVVTMYEAYAEKARFETRLGTTKYNKEGILTHRYILCNKAGQPAGQNFDSLDDCTKSPVRHSNFKVTNCRARIKLSIEKGGMRFELYGFIENHNHGFVSSYNLDLTKKRKKLNFSEMEYIAKCRLANVGPIKVFRLQTVLKGGHHMVRDTKTGLKNWARDIDQAIGLKDAKMVVANMKARATNLENFTFLHQVVHGELVAMFWADGVSKCNYDAFGDVLAFDATYNIIFVPFTGVDHHKKCVTFGAGILYSETIESYEWLLNAFLQAHAKQPRLVLSDQDPAMKQAVNRVLDKATHRLCMWHIMKKLPLKVTFDMTSKSAACSCRGFIRIGYLCRHVFCVFRHHQVDKIPPQYIQSRWLRDALPLSVFGVTNRYCAHQTRNDTIRHRIIDNIQQCADRVRGNDDRLAMLDEPVLQIKNQICEEFPNEPDYNKKSAVIQDLKGPSTSAVVSFTAPQGIKNKGSGTNKRLIGPGEKALENSKKTPRKCSICKQYVTDHDKRNCPTKKKAPVSETATPNTQEEPAHLRV
ncbi:protein FAR-RED IMPAIRED RESPONSE 1-like [Bidens hawaiensis]|uniref:protein FAR-RED IMPAIRED RESPONSE 1-like n=1 Tax=Bidens hawaiensis TaxID=980011 RepID=UPI00404B0983